MRPRAWLLAAALAALATGSAACGVADAGDLDVAGRRSGASAAARSGGFTALLEDDPSWKPFSAPRGFEAGGGAAPRRAAAAASAFADVPGSGWGGFEGQGEDEQSESDVEVELRIEQSGIGDEAAVAAMLRELMAWAAALVAGRGGEAGEDRFDRADRAAAPGALLPAVLLRLRDAALRTGSQVVALEITLESSVRAPRRAPGRPLLRHAPEPLGADGRARWADAAGAAPRPRLCPLLLGATVVFALAAALACHFSQAWEVHERARQARAAAGGRIEVAANNPLLEPALAGQLLDTQGALLRR